MDAGLVGEGVVADDRLVGRHRLAGDLREQARWPDRSARVSMLVRRSKKSLRVLSAITTSSIEVLPARSPMPLIVHSTWRAPLRTAASELATARPRSLWQCALQMTWSAPGDVARM